MSCNTVNISYIAYGMSCDSVNISYIAYNLGYFSIFCLIE